MPNCQNVKSEFTSQQFSWGFENPNRFLRPIFSGLHKTIFLLLRIISVVSLIAIVISSYLYVVLGFGNAAWMWWVFPTNWALLIYLTNQVHWLVLIIYFHSSGCSKYPRGLGVFWIWNVAASNLLGIWCLFYWINFYLNVQTKFVVWNYWFHLFHGIPLILMLTDSMLSSVPIRVAHCVYSLCLDAAVWLITAAVFFATRVWTCDTNGSLTGSGSSAAATFYPQVDWCRLSSGILEGLLTGLFSLLLYSIGYLIHSLKVFFLSDQLRWQDGLDRESLVPADSTLHLGSRGSGNRQESLAGSQTELLPIGKSSISQNYSSTL